MTVLKLKTEWKRLFNLIIAYMLPIGLFFLLYSSVNQICFGNIKLIGLLRGERSHKKTTSKDRLNTIFALYEL
jgi:hypothetical protein